MRAKTKYGQMPNPFDVVNREFNADVIIRDNIAEVDEQYECDEYIVEVPKSKNLEYRVAENFSEWLEKAKFLDEKKAEAEVRAKRNELLAESDAMMVEDRPTDKEAWATYRQALRDITKQAGFPYDVEFPAKP